MITERENYLRALENRHPEWIPCRVMLNSRNWKEHRERLEDVVLSHPRVFPGHERGNIDYDEVWFRCAVGECIDSWGCVWRNVEEGHIGIVTEHPLDDWDKLGSWQPPPLEKRVKDIERQVAEGLAKGHAPHANLEHGFLFLRLVYLHTDGYIREVIPDLIDIGVTMINLQDLVNGLDNIARLVKDKINISLDIDRQRITAFGTPKEVDAHIRQCIETLGSPEGGLSVSWGVYPGTPIDNIEAAVRAMDKYRTMWA